MPVYMHKGSPFYHYDFQMRGRRFHGSTKCRNRREAEAVERGERERARELLKQGVGEASALTIDIAAGRYWAEVGRHHTDSTGTWRDLERLVSYFGKDKLLADIGDDEVTQLVAWRRGHRVKGKKNAPFVSPSTVNRSVTQPLQKLFTRARRSWALRLDREPDWRVHRLQEPQERVRELHGDEAERIDAAMRADYEPVFNFARASGLRLRECLLRWSEVNWNVGQISKIGKGRRVVTVPITPTVRAILWPLRDHHEEWVFTYIAERSRGGREKGKRYPITLNGLKTEWRRLRERAKVHGFRFHDFRHDLATRLLRETGNLKLVQRALNHADIKTTTRYAHVLTEEIASALEGVQKSRNKSRSGKRKAG